MILPVEYNGDPCPDTVWLVEPYSDPTLTKSFGVVEGVSNTCEAGVPFVCPLLFMSLTVTVAAGTFGLIINKAQTS